MKHARALFTVLALAAPAVARADTFVLVHGAFQDASSWSAVADALAARGHDVVAVDLPGRDATGEAAQAVTLEAYVTTVGAAVAAADAPVILVGHSFGGITISGVAERMPERIDRLIFVAAYVPLSGEFMETLAFSDGDNGFTAETFVIAEDYSHAEILAADQVRVFGQDADEAQSATLMASMIREPLAPIGSPVVLSEALFGTVPKAFIRTLQDGVVSTPLQTMMIDRAGITRVRDIDTGHLPYLSQPDELAALILDVAE